MDNLIYLSHATYGATAAATYAFVTSEYQPPVQERYYDTDVVKNQNGMFKWLYDNGPGFNKWQPFKVRCENAWSAQLGATAGAQYNRLKEMWDHPGVLGMRTPDGTYTVHWAGDQERAFRRFPKIVNEQIEYTVVVQFEEGTA